MGEQEDSLEEEEEEEEEEEGRRSYEDASMFGREAVSEMLLRRPLREEEGMLKAGRCRVG